MKMMLEIEPNQIKIKDLHKHLLSSIGPRPIALASTIDSNGINNVSPFSFFNVFSANPPIAIFSPARRVRNNTTKDTLDNIQEIKELQSGAAEKINKIAIETSSELIQKLIGAEVNNSSISAIVDDLSKRSGDKYYGN